MMNSVSKIVNAHDLRQIAKSLDHVSWYLTCKALHAKIFNEAFIIYDVVGEKINAQLSK